MCSDRTDPTALTPFAARMLFDQVERGPILASKFDAEGVPSCIITDADAGELPRPGCMDGDAPAIRASRPTQLPKMREPHGSTLRSCTLHVCISCRAPGSPREPRESRAGFLLHQELRATLQESWNGAHVEVRPAECLSMCRRPCGFALSSPGAWTYLFGDQHPGGSARDILECVSLYIGTRDGFMPRERRPKSLRASILGRVPPLEAEQ